MSRLITILLVLVIPIRALSSDSTRLLIADVVVQIEATEAMNAMYNFDFREATKQYNWLMQKYPDSPLSYFLLGLNEWWKMMPNTESKIYDDRFHYYMDTAITIAERMLDIPEKKVEGAFFLAASYAFKGRLYSDRGQWGKAASVGTSSLKYLELSREHSYLSPELLFGDGLYNYYSIWIPDNYPILRPVLAFFPDGDKELGLEQLREVSHNAFYTRIEAQIFLMQILANEKQDYQGALNIAEYLFKHYPENPYFHKYYARYLYSLHRYKKAEPVALEILSRIDSAQVGYEANSGRYASFFLGQIYQYWRRYEDAEKYYLRTVEFAEEIDEVKTGYTLYSILNLGRLAKKDGRKKEAKAYFRRVKKLASRKQGVYKSAKKELKEL
ncbi:MAG: tetratricopeptide repeat protein [Bacteroidota bacterium]